MSIGDGRIATAVKRVVRGRRQQDLSSVSGRADASGRVHRDTHVAGLGQRRAAAVDADANADVRARRPLPLSERSLYRDRRIEGMGGASEHGEELIATCIYLMATGALDAPANDRSHLPKHCGVAVAEMPDEMRGPFDIREQERHGAAG